MKPNRRLLISINETQVGFDMIDVFAKSVGISMDTIHFKALFGQGEEILDSLILTIF